MIDHNLDETIDEEFKITKHTLDQEFSTAMFQSQRFEYKNEYKLLCSDQNRYFFEAMFLLLIQ
jgi:hypothetical protein